MWFLHFITYSRSRLRFCEADILALVSEESTRPSFAARIFSLDSAEALRPKQLVLPVDAARILTLNASERVPEA